MNRNRKLWVGLLSAALAACGGGGGDGGNGSGTPPLTPLSITAASPPAGTTGAGYPGYRFTASGGTPPFSWSESGALPPGLALSTAGQLSGNPSMAGTYSIKVTVTDSSAPHLAVSTQVSLKINDSMIVIAAVSAPLGTVGDPYAGFSFSASGGSPPYTWQSSGTLPPGLTLASDGTVSGTPTQVGSFSFSVTATDSAQPPVASAPLATQVNVNPATALTLNATPAPPPGVVGTPYGPFSFSTSGGTPPLTWSITAGSLPPGLSLASAGSLGGTPAAAGTFTFTVTATDSSPKPVSSPLPFSITVTLPPTPTINNQESPTGTVGSAYSFQFTASNGLAPLAWSETPALTMGLSLSQQGVLSGTPTTAGQFPISIDVSDAANRTAPPFPTTVRVSLARPAGSFTLTTGSMSIPRSGHAATLLLSGDVLVTGGGNGGPDPTAELYNPATQTFTRTVGNMTEARSGHTSTLLNQVSDTATNYGKVLIVGSVDLTAELYNPSTGTFAATGSMHHARTSPTATQLNTGKVLIVGGNTTAGDLTAELYDPIAGTFSDTGSTTILRTGHTATLLADGQVLIAGGTLNGTNTATAELYDPTTGSFTMTTGNMSEGRSGHTATLLGAADNAQNGWVLIIGTDSTVGIYNTADLYNPTTETFTTAGSLYSALGSASPEHTASLRNDGTVLAAGGYYSFEYNCGGCGMRVGVCDCDVTISGAALFAPESDGFTVTGSLNTPRDNHTATVLQNGSVLVVGGTYRHNCFRNLNTVLASAELFTEE